MQTIIMYVLKTESIRRVKVTMDNMNTVFESGEIEILKDNCDSEIRKFYAGKNILLTGCTGFLGTLILEKLLRVCTEISKLYIIVRPKRGLPAGERIKLYFENVVFNGLQKINPNFMEKVVLIQGNLASPSLGLCAEDRQRLVENVNIIIHNAAMVQFKPKPSVILQTNVISTQKMLELSTECSHFEAFVYISTAYSHPSIKCVEEKCYPSPANLRFIEDIIRADEENASGLSGETLDDILQTHSNLYAFSKAAAEGVVQDYSRTASFPCMIFRPTLVAPSYEGPTRAWIQNLNALAGPNMSISLGLLHVIPATGNVISDNVPGDMTVNYLLALIWDHVTHRKSCKLEVYNYGSSDWNPISYEQGRKLLINTSRKYPLRKMVWYPTLTFINNIYIFFVIHMLLTMTPAAVYDLIRIIRMKKAMAVNMVWTKTRQLELYYPFIACTWIVKTNKAKNLLSRMNAADLEEFKFDLSLLDWKVYFVGYLHSFRMFWKETPNDLIIARKKYRVLQILHYTLCSLFGLFLLFLCYIIVCSLFC